DEHRPTRVGIETTYYGKSAGAAIKMGQGRGVAMAAAARAGAAVVELAPRSIKQAVTGNGGASKDQVAAMAVSLLGLARRPRSADASDALGCALAVAMLSEGIPIGRGGVGAPRGSRSAPTGLPGASNGASVRRPGRKLR
ncbi:MAG TPA: crossover junction endodeoxyribonuclease RuvC, partial [Planctomycetota bacterium]|nr:crossover junction endodeoxyribonuclease RuvC [Planctomycetota bacterium]